MTLDSNSNKWKCICYKYAKHYYCNYILAMLYRNAVKNGNPTNDIIPDIYCRQEVALSKKRGPGRPEKIKAKHMYLVHPNGDNMYNNDDIPVVQEYVSPFRTTSNIQNIESPPMISISDDADDESDDEQQQEMNDLLNYVDNNIENIDDDDNEDSFDEDIDSINNNGGK